MSEDTASRAGTFPRSARLRTPRQFQETFANARRLHGGPFRLHVRVADPAAGGAPGEARLGISVSRKVSLKAVERNRIRRQARESFRRVRTQLPPGDYVLLAQREAAGAPAAALREALAGLWRRAAALKPVAAAPTMPVPASPPAVEDPSPPPIRER